MGSVLTAHLQSRGIALTGFETLSRSRRFAFETSAIRPQRVARVTPLLSFPGAIAPSSE
jgi:hypothetical protein